MEVAGGRRRVMRVLVVNAGSSTLKLRLLGSGDETLADAELDAPLATVDHDALARALDSPLRDADAVGHRIVHGGQRFRSARRIDTELERDLRALGDLAPLHQAKSLAALDAVSEELPELPAVACFDTAFHATLEPAAATYALPEEWRERWDLRRYGFHGLSHSWVAQRAPLLLRRQGDALRIVSCHLGAGASLCAIGGGRSRDTTMGFTPLEGLVMATRSGSVDPGLLTWLLERERTTPGELAQALEHRSGLLALGGTADMRELLARASDGDRRAGLAIDVYVHRLRSAIGAMCASLDGVDALVFTGGVGERSPQIRDLTTAGLGFLGLGIDGERNEHSDGDRDISASNATAATLVINSREDLEISAQVRSVLR
jgi:acetate kinase